MIDFTTKLLKPKSIKFDVHLSDENIYH